MDARDGGARARAARAQIPALETLDLTGGAPELNAHFRAARRAARGARPRGDRPLQPDRAVRARSGGHRGVPRARSGVAVVASLPCYTRGRTSTRSAASGVFERSIEALRRLNALGYGAAGLAARARPRLQPARRRACRRDQARARGRLPARAARALRHRVRPPAHDHQHADQALRPRARARRRARGVPGAAREPLQSRDAWPALMCRDTGLGRLGRRALRLRLQPDARAAARRPARAACSGRRRRSRRSTGEPIATGDPLLRLHGGSGLELRRRARRSKAATTRAAVGAARARIALAAARARALGRRPLRRASPAGSRGSARSGPPSSSRATRSRWSRSCPGSLLTLAARRDLRRRRGAPRYVLRRRDARLVARLPGRALRRARRDRARGSPATRRFAAIDRAIGAQGRRIVFLLRLSPVFPFNLLNYALGLTRVRFADYVVASRRHAAGHAALRLLGQGWPATSPRSRAAPRPSAAPADYALLARRASLATVVVTAARDAHRAARARARRPAARPAASDADADVAAARRSADRRAQPARSSRTSTRPTGRTPSRPAATTWS